MTIQELIINHKTLKQECFEALQELSKIDESKLSEEEIATLRSSKIVLGEELHWRNIFIGELEYLLPNEGSEIDYLKNGMYDFHQGLSEVKWAVGIDNYTPDIKFDKNQDKF